MIQYMRLAVGCVVLVCLLSNLLMGTAATGQDVILRQVTSIGEDQNRPLEELLVQPSDVTRGPDGRIFVGDAGDFAIKVYDDDGDYLYSIGREGEGPGEFQSIEQLGITPAGHLFATDRRNGRITTFTREGDLVETYPVGLKAARTKPHFLSEGEVLMLFADRQAEGTPLLHVMSDGFAEETSSFGALSSLEGIPDGDTFRSRSLSIRPGSFTVNAAGNTLWYAPRVYDGRIYQFTRGSSSWEGGRSLRGFALSDQPVAVGGNREQAQKRGLFHERHYRAGSEAIGGYVYNISHRVFTLQDGRIVHFSTQWDGEQYRPYVEVFEAGGELAGHGPVARYEGFEAPEDGEALRVVHKDDEGRFYLIDRRSFPVVRVVNLKADW